MPETKPLSSLIASGNTLIAGHFVRDAIITAEETGSLSSESEVEPGWYEPETIFAIHALRNNATSGHPLREEVNLEAADRLRTIDLGWMKCGNMSQFHILATIGSILIELTRMREGSQIPLNLRLIAEFTDYLVSRLSFPGLERVLVQHQLHNKEPGMSRKEEMMRNRLGQQSLDE